jgi:ABC-2 type transport system ATP-binding protein
MGLVVDVRNATFTYAGGTPHVRALNTISLSVFAGESVGVVGPSGAGKTTLLKLLNGDLRENEGRVQVPARFGRNAAGEATTGHLPEEFTLQHGMSGVRWLEKSGKRRGVRTDILDRTIRHLLGRLRLIDVAARPVETYPRRTSVMFGIAGALLARPQLILLDQPSAGLDLEGRMMIRELLEEERRRGAAIILTSHTIGELESGMQRILWINHGAITGGGTLQEALPGNMPYTVRLPQDPMLCPGWRFLRHESSWSYAVNGKAQLGELLKALDRRGFHSPLITPGIPLESGGVS